MTFIADVSTAKIADLVVIRDNAVADGSTANMLRARVTDAFGNALAGQTVSVMADNGAAVASTMTTKPDGTVEISVTSQTAGISTVTATINSSSQSRDVTFIADVRTAQIADLVVIKDGSEADGSTANTLRARVTDAFGNTLAGQTVSVAHKPWRIEAANAQLSQGAQAVYDALFASAHPTAENTFKLLLAKRTLASVLAEARAQA